MLMGEAGGRRSLLCGSRALLNISPQCESDPPQIPFPPRNGGAWVRLLQPISVMSSLVVGSCSQNQKAIIQQAGDLTPLVHARALSISAPSARVFCAHARRWWVLLSLDKIPNFSFCGGKERNGTSSSFLLDVLF